MKKRWLSIFLLLLFSLNACGSDPKPPLVEQDLVAVLKSRSSLQQFAKALESTDVAAGLQKEGSYTILAPMDAAVKGKTLDRATIRHHILMERLTFSDLAGESSSYTTLHTDEVEIDATDSIRVGDALMVESDITATNGVIHVIDKVLTPEEDVPTNLSPAAPAAPAPAAELTSPAGLAPAVELDAPSQEATVEGTNVIPAAPIVTQ